jgi:Immunity protein 26
MVTKKNRQSHRRKPGNVIAIPDGDKGYFFGRELRSGVVAFYDFRSKFIPEISQIIGSQVLFKIPIMDHALKAKKWEVISWVLLDQELLKPVDFFIQDVKTKQFSIYRENGAIVDASRAEIVGLERAAGWDPEHVVDRLNDHFSGRPNKWLRSLLPQ